MPNKNAQQGRNPEPHFPEEYQGRYGQHPCSVAHQGRC